MVGSCDVCDKNGKVATFVDCDLCFDGFNHIKRGDVFFCRICGKEHPSRFEECCASDCPACSGKRGVKEDCPDCGGDKIITPLEAERNRKRKEGKEKE
jgi:hypothetical protein